MKLIIGETTQQLKRLKKKLRRTIGPQSVIGEFDHAALKNFDFQLTKDHCKPSLVGSGRPLSPRQRAFGNGRRRDNPRKRWVWAYARGRVPGSGRDCPDVD